MGLAPCCALQCRLVEERGAVERHARMVEVGGGGAIRKHSRNKADSIRSPRANGGVTAASYGHLYDSDKASTTSAGTRHSPCVRPEPGRQDARAGRGDRDHEGVRVVLR